MQSFNYKYMIKLTFKNIIYSLGSLLFVALFASFLFFTFSYFNGEKKLKEFQTKVKQAIEKNAELDKKIIQFEKDVLTYEKEKQDLLDKLSKKEVIVIEKEKIIYVDGELQIPEDYLSLKNNYLILGENYELVKSMYASLLEQSKKDFEVIKESQDIIVDLKNQNTELLDLLNNTPNQLVPFIQHSVLGGVGLTITNEKSYHAGYVLTIMNKLQFEAIISFPPEISILAGVKF